VGVHAFWMVGIQNHHLVQGSTHQIASVRSTSNGRTLVTERVLLPVQILSLPEKVLDALLKALSTPWWTESSRST